MFVLVLNKNVNLFKSFYLILNLNENLKRIYLRGKLSSCYSHYEYKMQCLEDNEPDVKENELKTLEPEANEEKVSDITKIMSINENIDIDIDGSCSTGESVINLKLSSASTRTLIGRASSLENDEENKQNEQNKDEHHDNSISREIVNINLNEDISNIDQKNTFINESKQITKLIDDIPRALIITDTDNLQDVCCTKTSKKSIKFVSYTNLEYDIVESKSLCTLANVNRSVNNSAKTIFRQGDIINVNTAQIKTLFNTYRKPFEMNNHSDLGIRENRAIATNLKNIVSELASTFSISSDSKKGSFSSSNNYNASEISQTTLTTSNAPNILIINSSSFFNQIYLESENKFERPHEKAIVIDDKQEIEDIKDTVGIQKNNESEKFSFRNKSEVATVSVNVRPDFYKKKHVYSESNMQKDYRIDLTRVTCMKSVMSGTEDIFDHEEYKLKITKNELWETLILALDITAKRLEDTLSEKIVSKVNKSLNILSKSINLPTLENADLKADTKLIGDTIKHGKVLNIRRPLLAKKPSKLEIDACLQCDIVSTSFIDEHMQKYKLDKAKYQSLLKETKIAIDNLGGLAPSKKHSLEITAKDSPIVLTKIPTGKKRELQRFKTIIRNSFRFLIENALVIISVPSFLFVLFLLYGVILLAMKPW